MNLRWQILKCLRTRHVQHAFRFLFSIDRGDKQSRYALVQPQPESGRSSGEAVVVAVVGKCAKL